MRPGAWLAVSIALTAVGCASTSHPGGETIIVTSDPPGATAEGPGGYKVKTPGVLYAYPGAREMEITVGKDGFVTTTVFLKRETDNLGECFGKGLTTDLIPPGTDIQDINIVQLSMALMQQLLLLMFNCPMNNLGLQPKPVYVILDPIPPVLRSPRN